MSAIISEPAAAVLLVLDEAGSARLTDLATATGKSLSTVQRAVEALERSGLVQRKKRRGSFALRTDAPRSALVEVAEWRVGLQRAKELRATGSYIGAGGKALPTSIRRPEIRRRLPEALMRIVDAFKPDRIVLFGSQARGDADAQSDVDLLVVFSDEGDRRERQVAIRRLLADMPFSKDVIATSQQRYAHPLPGTVTKSAISEGVTLYER